MYIFHKSNILCLRLTVADLFILIRKNAIQFYNNWPWRHHLPFLIYIGYYMPKIIIEHCKHLHRWLPTMINHMIFSLFWWNLFIFINEYSWNEFNIHIKFDVHFIYYSFFHGWFCGLGGMVDSVVWNKEFHICRLSMFSA